MIMERCADNGKRFPISILKIWPTNVRNVGPYLQDRRGGKRKEGTSELRADERDEYLVHQRRQLGILDRAALRQIPGEQTRRAHINDSLRDRFRPHLAPLDPAAQHVEEHLLPRADHPALD